MQTCMGLLMSSVFQFSFSILPIPMFDRRDHPSVPTMNVAGHGGGRRSRMARRATAAGGAPRPWGPPTPVSRLEGWALMTGQLGGSAVPRRSSRVRGPPLDPTTLYSVRPTAGDHDASCASEARLPGGWDHSGARLEAHGGTAVHHPPRKARSTGLTGRPCFEVSSVPLETEDQTALRTTPSGITPAVA